MRKWNNKYLGFIMGLIAPSVVVFTMYYNTKTDLSFMEYLIKSYKIGYIQILLKLAILINLVLFIPATRKNKMEFGKGVIAATFVYGFFIIYMYLK